MNLCDAGPLIAIIDEADAYHQRCVSAMASMPPRPLVTTWPCLAEAMHFLGRRGGFPAQDDLWQYLADGLVVVHLPADGEWARMRALMDRYRDTPMDLADASLVAAAEHLGVRRIFTVDRHFRVYRIQDKHAFEVIP
jgi:predicted nucleic acid-binding protein